MAERPILFSAPMVRAILSGQKTQTRRVLKTQPVGTPHYGQASLTRSMSKPVFYAAWDERAADGSTVCMCPYGVPGDRLWVRETFAHIYTGNGIPDSRRPDDVVYKADGHGIDAYAFGPWCPSIHMPRWASRIALEITSVRVERLQDIREGDAMDEGAEPILVPPDGGSWPHVEGFEALWKSINGAESWDANPWVWVVEFKRAAAAMSSLPGEGEKT